jgi:hypothetical protein
MEGLIELVAASFLRHGIECPAAESSSAQGQVSTPAPSEHSQAFVHEPTLPSALPEHNYRKQSEADPAR